MDIWERFDEEELPDQKHFYSNLQLDGINDKDYQHGQNIWNTFNTKI